MAKKFADFPIYSRLMGILVQSAYSFIDPINALIASRQFGIDAIGAMSENCLNHLRGIVSGERRGSRAAPETVCRASIVGFGDALGQGK